jgi:hypothetical protein
LHFATYPTQRLKGLEDTIIITTKVEFQVDKASKVFRTDPQEEGLSYRKEYNLKSFNQSFMSFLFWHLNILMQTV